MVIFFIPPPASMEQLLSTTRPWAVQTSACSARTFEERFEQAFRSAQRLVKSDGNSWRYCIQQTAAEFAEICNAVRRRRAVRNFVSFPAPQRVASDLRDAKLFQTFPRDLVDPTSGNFLPLKSRKAGRSNCIFSSFPRLGLRLFCCVARPAAMHGASLRRDMPGRESQRQRVLQERTEPACLLYSIYFPIELIESNVPVDTGHHLARAKFVAL